jgi:hypothetical protein
MSLPKKKSRSIIIDAQKYRWISSGNDYGIDLYVELFDNPGQKLHVIFAYKNRRSEQTGTGKVLSQGSVISPQVVEKVIKQAFSIGWKPSHRAKELLLHASEIENQSNW